jgi:SPP1 gp7 family putative phage head morphogenesis protein
MPRTNLVTSKLAAKLSIRQIEALGHAEALGNALDRVVHGWWARFVSLLRQYRGPLPAGGFLRIDLQDLDRLLWATLGDGLRTLTRWGHDSAVEPLRHVIPDRLQQAVVALREDVEDTPPALSLQAPALPEPAESMTKAELWRAYKAMMFPPPNTQHVSEIVYATGWRERLAAITKRAAPEVLAQAVAVGYAKGENVQQLAARVKPALDGIRSSARRVARTEGMRVAHESQMRSWERLGDRITGYQIHATLDQHTRPWHASRSGTIYYREPADGQKGPEQMPRPPLEAGDPRERPAGTPHVAHN